MSLSFYRNLVSFLPGVILKHERVSSTITRKKFNVGFLPYPVYEAASKKFMAKVEDVLSWFELHAPQLY